VSSGFCSRTPAVVFVGLRPLVLVGVGPIPPAALTNFLVFPFPFSFRVHIVAGLVTVDANRKPNV
jgi:hypothetical protein